MIHQGKRFSPDWLAVWILLSAWSSLSGWGLSLLGCLDFVGVIVSYLLFLSSLILLRKHLSSNDRWVGWHGIHSRYAAPKIWLGLTAIAFIGGVCYAPNNYDYLTYRFPRVLYWCWDQKWSWVSTIDQRINYSATGFEWLMTPLLIVFKTDRLFFLINFISYLMFPGLVFSVFAALGISRRISWWWMWILSCGYCYILQAGSAGNDSFATIYFLASLYYLFQARTSSPLRNLALSCLAVALMTGAKASNLPLILPWFTVLFFLRRSFLKITSPATLALVVMVAAAVSFLPVALLNIHYTGDYAGDPTNKGGMKLRNPVIGVLGNSLQLAKDNLVLPIMPRAVDWATMIPFQFKEEILRGFPRMYLRTGELQIEEEAGLGLGIAVAVVLFVLTGIRARMADRTLIVPRNKEALWVIGVGAISWLTYMAKMGSEATSRLVAGYYPLIIAGVLVMISLDGRIVHRSLFRCVGLMVMLSAFPLLILSPARPLYPVYLVSALLTKTNIPVEMVAKYNQVYSVYAARSNGLNELAVSIPPGERVIGLLQTGNDAEVSLWRPFGSREVLEVTPQDSAQKIKERGINFVAVSQTALSVRYHTTIELLMEKWPSRVVAKKNITLLVHVGPETWYLLGL